MTASAPAPSHEPLSQELARVLRETPAHGVTMNYLLERTNGRGLYLLMILLCLPFVPLVSPPGLSGLLGGIVMILSLGLAVRMRPRLPAFIGERPLPPDLRQHLLDFLAAPRGRGPQERPTNFKERLLRWGVAFLRFIERWSRPRRTAWMQWRVTRSGNALLIALLAFLLALPLPSAPFFPTNGLPAYAIILLAAAMMEDDGVLVWFGYTLALATIVFFASIGGTIVKVLEKFLAGS
jgi:hypothetical protein